MQINGGDYVSMQNLYHKIIVDVPLDGTEVPATTLHPGRPNSTIFVQLVIIAHATHAAGKVFTLTDDAGTPNTLVGSVDVAAGAGVSNEQRWDFGPHGVPLAEGEGLSYLANTGGSGFTGQLHIEGYRKVTAITHLGTPNTEN